MLKQYSKKAKQFLLYPVLPVCVNNQTHVNAQINFVCVKECTAKYSYN